MATATPASGEIQDKTCRVCKKIRKFVRATEPYKNELAMKYLDPKADLTFKKVFGEHPDLVISLLNALLPFPPEEIITNVEYLTPEMVPENPLRKNSIVDVRCRDSSGRQYIVEMQMVWSPEFEQRVLFNASKAYVRQVDAGKKYELLQPVYSLNLVNEIFEPQLKEYYHYYRMVHMEHTEKIIDGLHLVFVELPKFTPHTYAEKKMQVLWLRYLTEINEQTREVPAELLANPEIKKAVEQLRQSAFTPEQLLGYEKFCDIISVERTLFSSGKREGLAEGLAEGIEKGREKGLAEGEHRKQVEIARQMKADNLPVATIVKYTGLSAEEIGKLQ